MHPLFSVKTGDQMLLQGNEAIARGALEAGVCIGATYPGTPSSEISSVLNNISGHTDLYFEYSINEKVAMEVTAAAANCGLRSICIMKHVGLNVAADVLTTLAYIGVIGGMVIVTADDPAMFSSQNEQDNRYYGKLSGLPVLEPSSVQEAKDMMIEAFNISERLKEPVLFRTTTRLSHATELVKIGTYTPPRQKGKFNKNPGAHVIVPSVSRKLHAKLLAQLEVAEAMAESSVYNFRKGQGKFGVICNGVSYGYVCDAISDLDMHKDIEIFRIGFSYPLPRRLIKTYLEDKERILIVEEGEPIMEEAIKAYAQEAGLKLTISGKAEGLLPKVLEYDPSMIRESMAKFFDRSCSYPQPLNLADVPEIPPRPPCLCAGCPHRATFFALKKAVQDYDIICTTDIGCYILGYFEPMDMGDFAICMGASSGLAAGFSKVTDKKVIGLVGDSTFFHSGLSGLINAVYHKHDFTYIILDNCTTAMTGQQPNPGVSWKESGNCEVQPIDIEVIVRALGVRHVAVINPYRVNESIRTITEALSFKGISIVIAKQPCILKLKQQGRIRNKKFFVSDKCASHHNCIHHLACPAFDFKNDRVRIDPALCTGCSVCAQICPEKAIKPLYAEKKLRGGG